jgi:hypothetical protein
VLKLKARPATEQASQSQKDKKRESKNEKKKHN